MVWREVANWNFRKVNSLGLDEALFFTDIKFLSTGGLSPFYRSLELWRQKLSVRERSLLLRWSRGDAQPNSTDRFPELQLSPVPTQLKGLLLSSCGGKRLSLQSVDRRAIYATCTKVAKAPDLSASAPTWTARLMGEDP